MSQAEVTRAVVGGVLIGVAAGLLLLGNGRIAGVSGVVGRLFAAGESRDWRFAFLLGLLGGGLVLRLVAPHVFGTGAPASLAILVPAGLLVGVGTQLGNGCTSGHGVCGVARLSPRSIVATGVFMTVGMLVVLLVRKLGGVA